MRKFHSYGPIDSQKHYYYVLDGWFGELLTKKIKSTP
jgi:hypothetical protein